MDNNEIKMEDDKYFKSKQHRYIFALVELDGTPRAKILGITKELYHDKNKAKMWRESKYILMCALLMVRKLQ